MTAALTAADLDRERQIRALAEEIERLGACDRARKAWEELKTLVGQRPLNVIAALEEQRGFTEGTR